MNIENSLFGSALHIELMNIELDHMEGMYRNLLTAGSITKETFDIIMKKIDDERNFLNGKNRLIKQ